MFTKILPTSAIIPALILGSTLSTAIAAPGGDDGREAATSERGDDHSETTEQGPSPLQFDIDLVGVNSTGANGQGSYQLLLDGEFVTLEMKFGSRMQAVSIYDDGGDFLVGYVARGQRVSIMDASGPVERGYADQIDPNVLTDYGAPGALLANPWWVVNTLLSLEELSFGAGAIGTFDTDDGDDPPALWWCLKAEIYVDCDSEGNCSYGFSLGWDC